MPAPRKLRLSPTRIGLHLFCPKAYHYYYVRKLRWGQLSAGHSLGGSLVLAGECGYSAVELLHRDGGVRRIECTDGVVLAALSAEDASGQMRALDSDGRPIAKSTNDVAKAIAEDRR